MAKHPVIMKEYHPPFTGSDEFTAVLVRKSLAGVENISSDVRESLLEVLGKQSVSEEILKAWKTTCNRIAAVKLARVPSLGGKSVVAASLHCSRSEATVDLVLELVAVLGRLGSKKGIQVRNGRM